MAHARLHHGYSKTALALTLLGAAVSQAIAQPFADAASSSTGYAKGTLQPAQQCAALSTLAFSLQDVVQLNAEIVAASGDTPGHCRVSGTIAPEIHFQVNLPAAWNGRFYMIGNGGHAGQHDGLDFHILFPVTIWWIGWRRCAFLVRTGCY